MSQDLLRRAYQGYDVMSGRERVLEHPSAGTPGGTKQEQFHANELPLEILHTLTERTFGMDYARYSATKETITHLTAVGLRGAAVILGALVLAFLLFSINAMRVGLNSTNAGLQLANAQLRLTNLQLHLTNARLRHTNEQLGTTNRQLRFTNAKLDSTNAQLGSTNAKLNGLSTTNRSLGATNAELQQMAHELASMRTSLQQMAGKIQHAKLLF